MKSFTISFQLFRKFCKNRLFNSCRHPANSHHCLLTIISSCCEDFCPVLKEPEHQQFIKESDNKYNLSKLPIPNCIVCIERIDGCNKLYGSDECKSAFEVMK